MEDDRPLIKSMTIALRSKGYRVIEAPNGVEGRELALAEQPDLVILDVQLPDIAGTQVCGELRRQLFDSPILMVTGLNEVEDRVRGLEAGADDYLSKPFDVRELLARVSALLRRRRRSDEEVHTLALGGLRVDFDRGNATRDNEPVQLTKTEFSLLELLARHSGRPISRKMILDAVWGYARTPRTRTVDTHIWRLRKKIGDSGSHPRWLKLVPGQGYHLDDFTVNAPDSPPS